MTFLAASVIISKLSREPEGERGARTLYHIVPEKGTARKNFEKSFKKGLTNKRECGKIVKRSRETANTKEARKREAKQVCGRSRGQTGP